MDERELIVVGGGISGLALAWHAARSGRSPLVIDAAPRLGGCLDSRRVDGGYWLELGAHTLYNSYSGLIDIATGCAAPPALVARGAARKRFGLLRERTLTTMGPLSVFRQFDWLELALHAPRAAFASKRGKTTREHYSTLVGPTNYRSVLAPFLSAVPSQPVDEFPAEGPGSLFKKRARRQDVVKSFTFDGGVGAIADAIAGSGVEVMTGAPVASASRRGGGFAVRLGDGRELVAAALALAVDPPTAARLTAPLSPALAQKLGRVATAGVDTVAVVVRRDAVALPELAFVVPTDDMFWSAVTRDPVPDDTYRAFTFHFKPGHGADERRARIAAVLGVGIDAFEAVLERRTVLPAPARHHADVVAAIDAALVEPRLAVTGNFFAGLSIEDCVARSGAEWARIAGALVPGAHGG
jgi:UDP-galactopyranose mutase